MFKRLPDNTYTLNIKKIVFNGPKVSRFSGYPLYRITRVDSDDTLNLRSGPDSESAVVSTIPYNGIHVYFLGEKAQVENYNWYKVRYGGIEGWVNSCFPTPDTVNNHIINIAKTVQLGYDLYRTDDPYEMIELASNPEVRKTVEDFLVSGDRVNTLLNELFTLQ